MNPRAAIRCSSSGSPTPQATHSSRSPVRSVPPAADAREQPAQRGGHLEVGHGAVGDEAEVAVDVDEPRQRDEVLAVVERVGRRAAGRRAARHGDEVVLAEPLGQLRAQPADHLDVGQPVERIERRMPPGVRDRLEEDAVDGRMLDAEPHDRAELVLVDPALDRGGQRDADAGGGAAVERRLLDLLKPPAADREMGGIVEAVELEVDVDAERGERGREARRRARAGCRWC